MEDYDKIQILGTGTFGSAWLVICKNERVHYVAKEIPIRSLRTKDKHAVVNEVKILGTLNHKNIISYKDVFFYEKKMCILMEYADDGDLNEKIKGQNGKLLMELQIIDWFVQILVAVTYIHSLNILHRDLKSQNIFLTKMGLVKIGDFGISCMLDHVPGISESTFGTPYYISPEICQKKLYNHKSDMWSMGVLLYELTTLQYPFIAEDISSLFNLIIKGEYIPISSCYGSLLKDLVSVLLQVDHKNRPSAAQLLKVPALQPHLNSYLLKVNHKDNPVIFECRVEENELFADLGITLDSNESSNCKKIKSVSVKDAVDNWEKETRRRSCNSNNSSDPRKENNSLKGNSTKSSISPTYNSDSPRISKKRPNTPNDRKAASKINFIQRNKILAVSPPQRLSKKSGRSPDLELSPQPCADHKPPSSYTRSRRKSACESTPASKTSVHARTKSCDSKIPLLATRVKRRSINGDLLDDMKDSISTKVPSGTSDSIKTNGCIKNSNKFKLSYLRKRSGSNLKSNKDATANKVLKGKHATHVKQPQKKGTKPFTIICNESVINPRISNVIINEGVMNTSQFTANSCPKSIPDDVKQHEKVSLNENGYIRKPDSMVMDAAKTSSQPLHSTLKESFDTSGMNFVVADIDVEDGDAPSQSGPIKNGSDRTRDSVISSTYGSSMFFNTPNRTTSARLRSHLRDIIEPEKLSRALEFVKKIKLSDEEFKNLWRASEALGFEHRWLLVNVMEIAHGEREYISHYSNEMIG